MFTGLIEQVGRVVGRTAARLEIEASSGVDDPWVVGESIAVNGCCLTLIPGETGTLRFDISEETWRRTNLGDFSPGNLVNIERAMRAGDRFGGHIVQGHVDTTGRVAGIEGSAFRFQIDAAEDRYLIDKGSIAIDGISLTVVNPTQGTFDTWIIPHTLEHTNLQSRRPGDRVNIEFDVIAKHVEKLLRPGIV